MLEHESRSNKRMQSDASKAGAADAKRYVLGQKSGYVR